MSLQYTDMTGRRISLEAPPLRIVSVVPSQTELLYDLGLEEEVVGITRFCIHPREWFRNKQRIGGTKQLHLDKIAALQPDLILANKEENTKSEIEALAAQFPVWISDIGNLEEALQMIREVADITGKSEAGKVLANRISSGFAALIPPVQQQKKVAYFIWRNPWMTVGRDTFIHDMLGRCGWTNVYEDLSRYPATTLEELAARKPDLVLLSSEPYPFKEQHIAELRELLPDAAIQLADGEMFSWYGSRLTKAPAYFRELLQRP
jgi:ABC-type Fe3+-hydroxamate transport system substrate-binding protein